MIMERKLNFFGHVCRMGNDRLVKQVMFGMMDGKGVREDRAESGWTTSRTGANWKSTNLAEWRRKETNGDEL